MKAETNLRARSLKSFSDKYHVKKSLRLSLAGFKDQGWMANMPLYAATMLLAKPKEVGGLPFDLRTETPSFKSIEAHVCKVPFNAEGIAILPADWDDDEG